ncbi:hypothetical protein RBA41_11210 [Massilia sp. CCM 9210]|uniref:baeRF3 domain-containing protein n=1 Tax=Massilia scottii TaxID=3057166 RepID=UPI002796B253|nr:hypothetical protein [Massilia sp. CCM 9210]MDQ1813875.1 hypothetical protein [Massilia sp. CCM 9210]
MQMLTRELLFDLMKQQDGPCLSLYLQTHRHHPDNAGDPLRFRHLVEQLEKSLNDAPEQQRAELLAPFRKLEHDKQFWQHTQNGLVVLSAAGKSHVLHLLRPVEDFTVVADTWHIKPLLRQLHTADRFQVLCLTRVDVRLYEGNRDTLEEVDLPAPVPRTVEAALGSELTEPYQKVSSYGMGPAGGGDMRHGHGSKKDEVEVDTLRFFRVVDDAITEHCSKPAGVPLVLVCLAQYQGEFRSLSKNPHLLPDGVSIDPGALSAEQLREKAWQAIAPAYAKEIALAVDAFHVAQAKGLGAQALDDTVTAALEGRVDTLLVSAEARIPGRIDVASMQVCKSDDFDDPRVGDVLNDVTELVLLHDGETLVIPQASMPGASNVAAILRY